MLRYRGIFMKKVKITISNSHKSEDKHAFIWKEPSQDEALAVLAKKFPKLILSEQPRFKSEERTAIFTKDHMRKNKI